MSLAVTPRTAGPDPDTTVLALPLIVAVRCGFHRDERYFLEPGQHLVLGEVDRLRRAVRTRADPIPFLTWQIRRLCPVARLGLPVKVGSDGEVECVPMQFVGLAYESRASAVDVCPPGLLVFDPGGYRACRGSMPGSSLESVVQIPPA